MVELVSVDSISRALLVAALVSLLLGVLGGFAVARLRGDARWRIAGAALGLLGLLAWILWQVWLWLVRVEPVSRSVGLHQPAVLLAGVGLFVAVGIALGVVAARWWEGGAPERRQ